MPVVRRPEIMTYWSLWTNGEKVYEVIRKKSKVAEIYFQNLKWGGKDIA